MDFDIISHLNSAANLVKTYKLVDTNDGSIVNGYNRELKTLLSPCALYSNIPQMINNIIIKYLNEMNESSVLLQMQSSENNANIPKRSVVQYLKEGGLGKTKIIELFSIHYKLNHLYEVFFYQRPLGFSGIMDTNGRNLIVSSIQDPVNTQNGMTISSIMHEINGIKTYNMKHKHILKLITIQQCPFYVVFKKFTKTPLKSYDAVYPTNEPVVDMLLIGCIRILKDNKEILFEIPDKIIKIITKYYSYIEEKLKLFHAIGFRKVANIGQLFVQQRNNTNNEHNVVVKIKYEFIPKRLKDLEIRWGSGSRKLDYNDIICISYKFYTSSKLCFSIVGQQRTLNLKAEHVEIAEMWVNGLNALVSGHSNKKELEKELSNRTDEFESYSSDDFDAQVRNHYHKKRFRRR